MKLKEKYSRVAMIARWKPVHLGHEAVLHGLCRAADHVVIGLGSSNRYDVRNPFTAAESQSMIEIVLRHAKNYSIVPIPDLGDGQRWTTMVTQTLGPLDVFVTANEYVHSLLQEYYTIVHPVEFITAPERVRVNGTMVRVAMAQGDPVWKTLVSPTIAEFLEANGLIDRFCKEFAEQTLINHALDL